MKNSKKKHYRSCFRRIVAQEVIINLLTEQEAAHKYHVSRIFVRRWIRWYKQNYVEPYILPTMKSKKDASEQDRIKQLEKKLKDTQKALREAELKNELLDTMINIAEDEYRIPVRKKPGSQPSPK